MKTKKETQRWFNACDHCLTVHNPAYLKKIKLMRANALAKISRNKPKNEN